MILQKFRTKFSALRNLLKFVYTRYPLVAISRDILFLVSTAAEIFSITLLGRFIDETAKILMSWEGFNLSEYFSSESFLFLVLIFVMWVVVQLCTQAREYLYQVIYEKIWQDSREMILAKVSNSNMQDVEAEKFQNLLTFVPAFSVDKMITTYNDFSMIISNAIRFVSALVMLFVTMHWTILILLVIALPETLVMHFRRKEIKMYLDEVVGKIKFLNYIQNVALQISNFPELRVNDTFSYLKRRYHEEYDEYLDGYLRKQENFYQDRTALSIVDQLFKFIYLVFVLAFSIIQKLSIGSFKALYDYVDVAYTSMYSFLTAISLTTIQLDYIDDFFDLIDYQGFGDYHHGINKLPIGTPTIEFKHLNFAYPDDPRTSILKDINIEIKPGEKVVFFGGDGSGKSTMVKILTGLYEITSGDYIIGGQSVKDLDRGELKRKLAVTFQDFINYNFSIRENVVISGKRKNIDNTLYSNVSNISDVSNFLKKEHLQDTQILGKVFPGGKELSPGYWQRMAIARTLYRNREIFIMDEPFTYVDSQSKKEIIENMFEYMGNDKTFIYITRNMDNLEHFDRIYHFDNGKVIEVGSWNELLKKNGKFCEKVKLEKE